MRRLAVRGGKRKGGAEVFNALIVCYLFLGGAGAGSLVVLCVFELANACKASCAVESRRKLLPLGSPERRSVVPQELFARSWPICFVVLSAGMLCLAFDLGRFDRALSIFLTPQPSAMAIGAYGLVVALVCAGFFAVRALFNAPAVPRAATCIFGVAGIVAGIIVAAYTGVLLQSMASVLFWMNPLLPMLFCLSSLSTGIALVFLGLAFTDSRTPADHAVLWLARADVAVIVLELACLAAYMLVASGSSGAKRSLEALVSGELMWYFWIGVIVCGLIVPALLDWFALWRNYRSQVLWVAALVLVGGLLLRICIVGAGAYDVTQDVHALYGFTAGSLGL